MHQALIAGLLCFCLQGNDFGQQNAPPTFAPRAFNLPQDQAQPAPSPSVNLRAIPNQTGDETRRVPPIGVGSQITDQTQQTNPIIIRQVPQEQIRESAGQRQVPIIEAREEFNQSADGGMQPQIMRIQSSIQDDRVRPATFQQSEAPLRSRGLPATNERRVAESENQMSLTALAREILERTLAPAAENLLPGKSITLKEALAQKQDRNARLQLVKDYWRATTALADFQFATEEFNFLSRITPPNSPESLALWQSEVASAEARVAEAKLASIDSQETLRQKLSFDADQLPVPSDTPWVGRYRTNFAEHASAGLATSNLKRIDRILPVMWQLVQRRAGAIDACGVAVQEMFDVYQNRNLPISELLDMHRRLRDQRIAFLAAVRDYNYAIADYAMSTLNGNGQPEQVVAMLLYDEAQGLTPVDGNSAIRQASAKDIPGYDAKSIRQFSAPVVNPVVNPGIEPDPRALPAAASEGQFSPSGNFNPRGNLPPGGGFSLPE